MAWQRAGGRGVVTVTGGHDVERSVEEWWQRVGGHGVKSSGDEW